MNRRWSFVKRFGRITRSDFVSMADTFIKAAIEAVGQPLVVNIILYKDIPHSVSAPEDGIQEWVNAENKKKELTRSMFLAELSSPAILNALVSDKEFIAAANIQLKIRLTKETQSDCTFGGMECKGLLSDRILFYFQSNNERACQSLVETCVEARRPSKILFGSGNGFEKCHPCSLS